MIRRRILGALVPFALVAACTRAPTQEAAKPSEAAKSAVEPAGRAPPAADQQEVAPPGAVGPAAAPLQAVPQSPAPRTAPASRPEGARAASGGPEKAQREIALRAARSAVEQARRDLEASMGDCAAACRALGSMEHATGRLCELATDGDDRERCEDATAAVLRAREKIRASCGSCPGGPSLEKSAPIPSRR